MEEIRREDTGWGVVYYCNHCNEQLSHPACRCQCRVVKRIDGRKITDKHDTSGCDDDNKWDEYERQ